jgi:hypothetical protein
VDSSANRFLQERVDLQLVDEPARHGMAQGKAGNLRELAGDFGDLEAAGLAGHRGVRRQQQ